MAYEKIQQMTCGCFVSRYIAMENGSFEDVFPT